MRPIIIECAAPLDLTGRVLYRWTCSRCLLHGDWRNWLSEAEDDSRRHSRDEHHEGRAVA